MPSDELGPAALSTTASETIDVASGKDSEMTDVASACSVKDDWEDDQSTCTSWTADPDEVVYMEEASLRANPSGRDRSILPPLTAQDMGREHIMRERLRSMARDRHRKATRVLGRSTDLASEFASSNPAQHVSVTRARLSPRETRREAQILKSISLFTFFSTYTRALTFANFLQGVGATGSDAHHWRLCPH
jgi:hypothetical protein